MRQLASVAGSLGLIVGAYLALAPISVEAAHADGRCGPPAVRLAAQEADADPNAQAIIDRCEEAAGARLVLAGLSVIVGLVVLVALWIVAHRHDAAVRRRRDARRAAVAADQRAAEQAQAWAEAAHRRDAALRG